MRKKIEIENEGRRICKAKLFLYTERESREIAEERIRERKRKRGRIRKRMIRERKKMDGK